MNIDQLLDELYSYYSMHGIKLDFRKYRKKFVKS